MHLTITARHFTLQDELKSYIEAKAEKIKRFYDGVIGMEIVLGWEKTSRYTEFKIFVNQRQIVIKESSDEIRKSFDLALDRVLRQIKRHKDKSQKSGKRRNYIPDYLKS